MYFWQLYNEKYKKFRSFKVAIVNNKYIVGLSFAFGCFNNLHSNAKLLYTKSPEIDFVH